MNEDGPLRPQQLSDVLEDIKADRQKDKDQEQEIAQVVTTPAWQEVLDQLKAKSSPEALFTRIRDVVYDGSKSNEQLGEMTRVAVLAADDLQKTIDQVTETVKAHER